MIAGNLKEMNLAEVLKLLTASGQNGVLMLTETSLVGSIYIKLGQIIHSSYNVSDSGQLKEGLESLAKICSHLEAQFRFEVGLTSDSESLIKYPTEKIIASIEKHVTKNKIPALELPSPNAIPKYLVGNNIKSFNAPPEALSLLIMADGHKTISEIAMYSDLEIEFVQKWTAKFLQQNMMQLVEDSFSIPKNTDELAYPNTVAIQRLDNSSDNSKQTRAVNVIAEEQGIVEQNSTDENLKEKKHRVPKYWRGKKID